MATIAHDYTYPAYAKIIHLGLAIFGIAAYMTAEFAEDGDTSLGRIDGSRENEAELREGLRANSEKLDQICTNWPFLDSPGSNYENSNAEMPALMVLKPKLMTGKDVKTWSLLEGESLVKQTLIEELQSTEHLPFYRALSPLRNIQEYIDAQPIITDEHLAFTKKLGISQPYKLPIFDSQQIEKAVASQSLPAFVLAIGSKGSSWAPWDRPSLKQSTTDDYRTYLERMQALARVSLAQSSMLDGYGLMETLDDAFYNANDPARSSKALQLVTNTYVRNNYVAYRLERHLRNYAPTFRESAIKLMYTSPSPSWLSDFLPTGFQAIRKNGVLDLEYPCLKPETNGSYEMTVHQVKNGESVTGRQDARMDVCVASYPSKERILRENWLFSAKTEKLAQVLSNANHNLTLFKAAQQ